MTLNRQVLAGVLVCGLLSAASSGFAHHSFMSVYDREKPFEMVGTVTKFEFRNPHVLLYIDVEDEGGNVTNWSLELLSANQLMRRGWKRDALEPGEVVTVTGLAARDGSSTAGARSITVNRTGETIYQGNLAGE